jgi:hypothetical protein
MAAELAAPRDELRKPAWSVRVHAYQAGFSGIDQA